MDSLAKNGSDDAKGAMAMLFAEACDILSGEDLRKALVDLRDMRDSHPAEFATCAMEYARLYIDDVLRREDIVDDLEWVRAHYVPLFREIDDGESPDDESEVSYLLVVCSGSRSGMAAAIKKVIGRFDGDDVGTAWAISDYCARRDPTKGMVSWITKALYRMGMGLDDVDDLASVMHKRAP